MTATDHGPIVVLGGTGTVGSRVAELLHVREESVRAVGRHTEPAFDWRERDSWDATLADASHVYLLLPDDTELPDGFLERVRAAGVRRVVLHSDRGVDVMGVERLQSAEREVRESGLEWTIIRPDWFAQNFETFFRDAVVSGRLCVPVGETTQGFVDAGDIAAVAVEALTTDRYVGQVLELTGPEALSFRQAVDVIGASIGREISFDGTPEAYRAEMTAAGLPAEVVEGMISSFGQLVARGDTAPSGVVESVLGRPARSLADYAGEAARRGVWT